MTDLTSLSPEFIVTPANVTARLGETAEFECAVNTGEQVQWEWVGHASLPLSVIQENGALLLIQVGEEQNGGVFRCRAEEMVAEAHLSVVGMCLYLSSWYVYVYTRTCYFFFTYRCVYLQVHEQYAFCYVNILFSSNSYYKISCGSIHLMHLLHTTGACAL